MIAKELLYALVAIVLALVLITFTVRVFINAGGPTSGLEDMIPIDVDYDCSSIDDIEKYRDIDVRCCKLPDNEEFIYAAIPENKGCEYVCGIGSVEAEQDQCKT